MTELLSGVEAPSDAELISRVRGGDVVAYGELFVRHVEAARRLGRQLVRGPDVDDLVSDAFAKTLTVLQNGGGPDVAFRAYLLTSVRRLHVDKIRAAKKVQPADDMTVFDDGVPFQDTAVANFENGAAARAFSSLPERWQLVLWHLEVEGQKPADIAPLLGMSANSVSALAYRAREGLRQAFLTMHLADSPSDDCRWVNEHLGAYVRKGLSKRDTTKVDEHLEGCRRCTAMYLELSEVNSNLAGIIAPLLLGAAAAGYVSSAGGAGLTGVSALFGRVRDAVAGNSAGGSAAAGAGSTVTTGGLVTAGGVVAASVAAVTAAAFVFGGGPGKEVITEADQPVAIVQTPAGPGTVDSSDVEEDVEERTAAEDAVAGDATDGSEEAAGGLPVSVSDDAGLEPSGTTDAPADVVTGDVPVSGPGPDAPGTGDGTVDGPADGPVDAPGTAPGTAPGDAPGETPGDGPGTGGPGTDQPGTEEPPREGEPGSSPAPNPPPSDSPNPPPTTSPTPSPTAPVAVRSTLTVSAAGIVEEDLYFSLLADPALPASIRIDLGSDPEGIVFAAGGADCELDPADPTIATCETTPTLLGAGIAGMPVIAGSTASFDTQLPLSITENQPDTDLSLTITTTDGLVIASPVSSTVRYLAPEVDLPTTVAATLDDDDAGQPERKLTVTVTGAPAGPARLELIGANGAPIPGAVRFETDAAGCHAVDEALECDVPTSGAATWELDVTLPTGQLERTSLRVTFSDETKAVVDLIPGETVTGGTNSSGTGPGGTHSTGAGGTNSNGPDGTNANGAGADGTPRGAGAGDTDPNGRGAGDTNSNGGGAHDINSHGGGAGDTNSHGGGAGDTNSHGGGAGDTPKGSGEDNKPADTPGRGPGELPKAGQQ